MDYNSLLSEINKGEISPCYLFVGEEEALKRDVLYKIKNRGFSLFIYDQKKDIWDILQEGLFEKRIVFIPDFSLISQKTKDFIIKYLNNPSLSIVLVISCKKIEDQSLTKAVVVRFPKLSKEALKRWIIDRFRENKKTINPSIAHFLIETIGNDIEILSSEIEKICLFCMDKYIIEENDIAPVVSLRFNKDIFELMDLVGNRKKKAVALCNLLLLSGISPTHILYMLIQRMRQIFSIKEGIKENIQEWQYKRLSEQAGLFSYNELGYVFSSLQDAEFKLKSYSQRSHPHILFSLIMRLVKSS
ncbi:TPA: DNA polymerase III subunit delta [bacterium]|nr:DNA polymerase III subunit delta [bacterium]